MSSSTQPPRVTLKGQVIAEIVAGNPGGRLKAVEYGQFGEITRVEWHDEPPAETDLEAVTRLMEAVRPLAGDETTERAIELLRGCDV